MTLNSDDIKQIVEEQEEMKSRDSISPVGAARNPADSPSKFGASKLVTALTAAATNAVLGHSYLSASVPKAENIASYLQHLQAQTKTNKNRPQTRSEKNMQGIKIERLNTTDSKPNSDEGRDQRGVSEEAARAPAAISLKKTFKEQ